MVREARHMSKLVDDLLALARGDAQRAVEPQPVDVTAIVRALCGQLAPAASAKGLTIEADLPDGPVDALGDITDLRRLFVILIDNAIKYTETGSIHVALAADDAQVRVTVRDTGIGIEKAAQEHIFDRFWRADKVRSRAEGGAGLGLSLAAQIVARHGGRIAVTSEVGQGSSFTVELTSARSS